MYSLCSGKPRVVGLMKYAVCCKESTWGLHLGYCTKLQPTKPFCWWSCMVEHEALKAVMLWTCKNKEMVWVINLHKSRNWLNSPWFNSLYCIYDVTRYIDDLGQERCNFSVLTMELRLSCTNPSTCWCNAMEMLSEVLALCEGNPLVTSGFPSQMASNMDIWCYQCC